MKLRLGTGYSLRLQRLARHDFGFTPFLNNTFETSQSVLERLDESSEILLPAMEPLAR